MRLANAAYCPLEEISDWSCSWCTATSPASNVQVLAASLNQTWQVQSYVIRLKAENTIVVAFRGSSGSVNWWNNLQVIRDQLPWAPKGVQVHKGFLKSFVQGGLQESVEGVLKRAAVDCPQCEVVFVGHSLGAVFAVLASSLLAQAFARTRLLIFGSPRIGNAAFSQWFHSEALNKSSVVRYVNERDYISRLPYYAMGYQHLATENWFTKGKWRVCDGSGEDPACSWATGASTSMRHDHLSYFNDTCCCVSEMNEPANETELDRLLDLYNSE